MILTLPYSVNQTAGPFTPVLTMVVDPGFSEYLPAKSTLPAFLVTSKMVVGERAVGIPLVVERVGRGPECDDGLDRKSTRLNSSHVAISYAVFCLKKKRKKTERAGGVCR